MQTKAYFFLAFKGGTTPIGTMFTMPPDTAIEEFKKRAVQVGKDLAKKHPASSIGMLVVRIETKHDKGNTIETTTHKTC